MQENINEKAQKERKKSAIRGALISGFWLLLSATMVLSVRWYYDINGLIGWILLILGVIELGMIAAVGVLLKQRLKEIEGGEEDVAAQY